MDTQPLDALPEATREIPVEKASRGVGLSSGIIFFIAIVIQLIGYFASYVFANTLGLDQPGGDIARGRELLGFIGFSLLIASSINGIADLRIGSAYTFFIARGKSPFEQTATYLLLRLILVGTASLLVWLFVTPTIHGTGPLAVDGQVYATFAIFLVLPLLWSVSTVYTQLKIAQGESIRSQYPILLESVVRTGTLLFVATHHPTVWTLTFAYFPGALVSTLYCLPAVRGYFTRFSWKETVGMFKFSWPLMGGLILSYTAGNAMPFLVETQSPDHLNAFYIFAAANGFRILALAVPTAVIVPLFPSLTSLHARGMLNAIRSQGWHALRFTAMAVVPAAMYLVVYRVPVLHVLYNGTVASGGGGALAMLAISSIPFALTMVIGTILNSIRLQRLELFLTAAQVVVMFGVAALLLPPLALAASFGVSPLLGASIAILASALAALAVNTYFLERHLGVRIPVRPILAITFSAAVGFFAVSRFNVLVNVSRWYQLLPGILLGFTVYAFVLAAVGELSQSDVRQLCGMAKIPSRISNPLSRLCWRKENPYSPDVPPPAIPPPPPAA
ncbi:MAG TPA: polysaccharide biosynthesis C-terminal domain-containing protein [Thermoplasmata archaeon]|nr:polysaccharide biosynthesis C-terminal domain-containing protein [Thermoplasmata archaeon]